jgi:hypothetical protein
VPITSGDKRFPLLLLLVATKTKRKRKRKGKKTSGKSKEKVKRIKQNEWAPLTKPRAFLLWFFFHSSSKAPKPYLRFNSQRSFKQKTSNFVKQASSSKAN